MSWPTQKLATEILVGYLLENLEKEWHGWENGSRSEVALIPYFVSV